MDSNELQLKSDTDLAKWQAGWKVESSNYILAEKEWTRRLAFRQLQEQFRLEDRLARTSRWWGLASAVIGVIGTLLGAWFGSQWQAQLTSPSQPAASSTAPPQQPAAAVSKGSVSAASSSTRP